LLKKVKDRPQTALSVNLPFSRSRWDSRKLRPVAGRLCRTADLICLAATFLLIVVLPFFHVGGRDLPAFLQLRISIRNLFIAALCLSAWRVILLTVGLYSPARTRSFADYLFRLIIGLNSCTALVGLVEVILRKHRASDLGIGRSVEVFWVCNLLLMGTVRLSLICYDRYLRPLLRRKRNLIIVGSGERAGRVFQEFKAHEEWDYSLVGFIDSEPQGGFVPANLILGGVDKLEEILMHTVVDEVVIALPMKSQYETVGHVIATCQMLGIQSEYFTDYFSTAVTKRTSFSTQDHGRVVLEVVTHDYRLHIKRMIDIIVSAIAILILSPIFIAMTFAVKFTSPGPVLFRQKRFGLNKRTFPMLKFRSMCIDAEARQAAVEHLNETSGPAFKIKLDPRMTPVGKFIRKYSLDELPQLFNVLLGDMSLVGPRPLPLRDVQRFSDAWLMRRFSVKPGITCLWQIMGRSNTDFERWIDLDLQYIDNWSLSLDLLILARTVPAVLTSRGAS